MVESVMDPELRNADSGDIPVLLPFIAAYHRFEGIEFDAGRTRDALRPLLTSDHFGRIWLIYMDEIAVGYVALCFGYSIEGGGLDAMIDEFYVDEGWRGQGIGTRVLHEVVARARKLGARSLYLEVARSNKKAQKLYQAAGFAGREQFFLMDIELAEET